MLLFLLPLFALALIIIPLAAAIRKARAGKSFSRKRTILLNGGVFTGVMILMTVLMPVIAGAEGAAVAAETGVTVGEGLKALAASLSTGFATIGTGIAVSNAASAALGAISEDSNIMGKSLIFVALAEGIAIYGLLISFMILNA